MIPSKFRQNSGPKPPPKAQNNQSKFPAGFKPSSTPSSSPGTMPGSMPFGQSQRKPPSPQIPQGNTPGSYRSQQQTPTFPRQRSGPSSSAGKPLPALDPRRAIVDQIIRDCYSKSAMVDGKKVPEIKYNTHILIREYSQYPSTAPPADLSPAQIGTVKSRILVVCTKHTGRVLLQKGKYNDSKKVYQIGRTWDLDELLCITRVANDAVILSLNRDYYWKSGDDSGRIYKFVHHLAVIYQRFTGHYPEMKGFTLESLGLGSSTGAPTSVSTPNSNISKSRDESPKTTPASLANTSTSNLSTVSNISKTSKVSTKQVDHYKDMDFTVNGKLPMKPMQVMDVDRPSPTETSFATLEDSFSAASTRQSTDTSHSRNVYDMGNILPKNVSAASLSESPKRNGGNPIYSSPSEPRSSNDLQRVDVLADELADESKSAMPTISEYAQKNGSQSPLRNFKPEREPVKQREVSDNLETAASYGLQLESQLGGQDNTSNQPKFKFELPDDIGELKIADNGADSIEEASLTGSSIETQVYAANKKNLSENQATDESDLRNESVIDDSIKEIEDFMVTQFGKEQNPPDDVITHSRTPSKSLARKLSEPFQGDDIAISSESAIVKQVPIADTREPPVSEKAPDHEPEIPLEDEIKFEKDPEIEELLDEIGWSPTDGTDQCVKMLRKELTSIKHRNVSELTTLDFGKDTLANEVKISSGEIDNLVEIFKKMEISFDLIAPQISSIENNSKGLQVEAVNKKILYNELNEIMQKVRFSDRDLQTVANYEEFEDISMVPTLEGKLLMLYDALGAIGSKTSDDDLSQMQALKQFHQKYENVSQSFVQRYVAYITTEFKCVIEGLNRDLSNIVPETILDSFRKQYAFAGVNSFVKCVSGRDFMAISDKFNAYIANLLDNILGSRTKSIHSGASGANSARNSRLIYNSDSFSGLKKAKSSRFGSTRILGRISGIHGEQSSKPKPIDQNTKGAEEINDAKVIVRLVKESSDFMLVIQHFLGVFFHLISEDDFSEYLAAASFEQRIEWYDSKDLDSVNYKTNSNDLLRHMNVIFGNYINKFTREVTPTDLITTQVLVGLFELLGEAENKNQDFVAYSFLLKLTERYRSNWDRFIANQVDLFNKSDVRAKGGVLPAVRNLNQIITVIETSLQESQNSTSDLSEVNSLITSSYGSLSKAAGDLFKRDDPLLKSNTHDEKERAYRNVAILQNLYSILQQLGEYESSTTASMTTELGETFVAVQREYFEYMTRMHLGRISEYVNAHSTGEPKNKNKSKKEDKILVRGICSSHTPRDMSAKINEMLKNMQKHVISSDTVFEHDLLDLLWKNLEEVVEGLFRDFHSIAKSIDKDIDESVSAGEIRRLFIEEFKLKQ